MTLEEEDNMRDITKVEHFDHQVSRVTFPNGSMLGVNTWEVVPNRREADGFTAWKYRLVELEGV